MSLLFAQPADFLGKHPSSEELVKQREDRFAKILNNRSHKGGDMLTLSGSLVECYKSHDLQLHWHLHTEASNTINNGEGPNVCIVLDFVQVGSNPQFTIDDALLNIIGSQPALKCGQNKPSVLIHVAEIVDEPQNRLSVIPTVVRLQTLNDCLRSVGCALKPSLFGNCVMESLWRGTDGEHIVFTGSVFRGKHKFPYQIVEGGSEILETIAKNDWNPSRDRPTSGELPNVLIREPSGCLTILAGCD